MTVAVSNDALLMANATHNTNAHHANNTYMLFVVRFIMEVMERLWRVWHIHESALNAQKRPNQRLNPNQN
jgi:hypothetical protein